MKTRTQDVDAVLRAANPIPPRPAGSAALDERARADLRHILATPAPEVAAAAPGAAAGGPPSSWRRRAVLTAAVAAVTVGAVVGSSVVSGQGWLPVVTRGTAYAATPPPLDYRPVPGTPDAATLLEQIADRTDGLPDDTGTGRYAHVELRDWSLHTRVDGERVDSEVVPQEISSWVAEDGSGRRLTTTRRPGWRPDHREETTAAPGELRPMWPLRSLSADDATLAAQLAVGHPAENGPAERLVAITDAYRQMPLPPAVRAAMLRYLAATPGLAVTGRVTDRAGRSGLAVSLTSDDSGLPTRYTLIIDPDDGRLLGSEDMLTTTAGKLNVPVPSVIGYTVYLSAAYTDDSD